MYAELYTELQRKTIKAEAVTQLCYNVRASLCEISRLSGVPIEPPKQTALLDELMKKVPQIIYASVPGAGGDDAIFALAPRQKCGEQLSSEIKTKFLPNHPELALLPVKLTGPNEKALTVEIKF